jgi:hypothetical protein
MTNPVDDLGNPRVDFVWGNFPLQPDDQRGTYDNDNQTTDGIWTNYPTVGSDHLSYGWDVLTFPTGDGGNTRQQTFTWDNHEIAVDNYEQYPGFGGGYPYDDTIPNVVVPNIIGLSSAAAGTALGNAGLGGSGNSYTEGATLSNDGKVFAQRPDAGTLYNQGDIVHFDVYSYIAPTGSISGFDQTVTDEGWTLGPNDAIMYLTGRSNYPVAPNTITVSGSSNSDYNQVWTVNDEANNDSYNTGGTAVWVTPTTPVTESTSSGGTWTQN